MANTADARTFWMKGVRLSFTDGLKDKKKPSGVEDAREKHSFNIIDETGGKYSEQNRANMAKAIEAACEKQWKDPKRHERIAEDAPKRVMWRKGEKFRNKEGKVYAGYEGNMAMSVSGPRGGEKRPKLLDRHKREVEEKDILDVCYGGSYADVLVSVFGTDKGSAGIFATAEIVRSHQQGEHMGGGYNFDESDLDELDDLEDDDDGVGGPSDEVEDFM